MIMTLLLLSCAKKPMTKEAKETIILAMQGSAEVSLIMAQDAKESQKRHECIIGYAISSALLIGIEALQGNTQKSGLLPAIKVDVSDCMDIPIEKPSEQQNDDEKVELDSDTEHEETEGELKAQMNLFKNVIISLLHTSEAAIGRESVKLKCKDKAWALASMEYARNIADEAYQEWAVPDGKVEIDSVPVIFDCE